MIFRKKSDDYNIANSVVRCYRHFRIVDSSIPSLYADDEICRRCFRSLLGDEQRLLRFLSRG